LITKLIRVAEYNDATQGVFLIDGKPWFLTLEEPWRNNQPRISCIPTGIYEVKRRRSPNFGNTFEVTNVPGRSHILFHPGNTTNDTQGCILFGYRYGELEGRAAVLESRRAFAAFMVQALKFDEFQLEIVSAVT
jgi:hypothetical protein